MKKVTDSFEILESLKILYLIENRTNKNDWLYFPVAS